MHKVFVHRSIVPAAAADVFRWHEHPDALLRLMPSRRLIRIERRTGGVHDGGTVTLSMGVGPLRLTWEAQHYGYVPDEEFCDEQVRGPFSMWRHTHRVTPLQDRQSLYEDRVEYELPGGPLAQRVLDGLFRYLLARAFARRHEIVRAHFGSSHTRHV